MEMDPAGTVVFGSPQWRAWLWSTALGAVSLVAAVALLVSAPTAPLVWLTRALTGFLVVEGVVLVVGSIGGMLSRRSWVILEGDVLVLAPLFRGRTHISLATIDEVGRVERHGWRRLAIDHFEINLADDKSLHLIASVDGSVSTLRQRLAERCFGPQRPSP